MTYHVYENWQAEGHKARIHSSDCSYCKNGQGVRPGSGDDNGQWHGPFDTMQQALTVAHGTGGNVSRCKHCRPS